MDSENVKLSVEELNDKFIAASPYFQPVISARAKRYNKVWGKLVNRGTFEYGQGYVKSKFQFHGGTANQSASRIWKQMQSSVAPNPDTNDAGYNACRYEASIVTYGIEKKQHAIFQTMRRTEDICLTDLLFKFDAEQHLAAIMTMLADVTLGEWENYIRDAYLSFCDKVICCEGLPRFTASFGADEIGLGGVDLNKIGLLSQEVLNNMYQFLYREAGSGALGMKNGMPIFGVMSSAETLNALIKQNDTRRTDFRYKNPEFLVQGLGQMLEYENFAHMQDPETERYKVSADGTKLIRVWPYTSKATTIGMKTLIDREYIDAPFEITRVIVKEVVKVQVPQPNKSIGSAKFDAIANYGEFTWSNIKNDETNPLGEIGKWIARFRASPEPMENSDRAFAILHRRNVGLRITLPDACDTSPQSDAVVIDTAATLSAEAVYSRVLVVLAECLACELGASVTVTAKDNSTRAAVITNYLGGTSYELTFATDAAHVTWMNTGSAIAAPTVVCA